MPLEFNVGELSARVRRALGVRGRMPLDIDERAAINIGAMDVDRAPFRADGARFYVSIVQAAVAGQNAHVAIASNNSTQQFTHVIDGAWISNPNAGLIEVDLGWPTALISGFGRSARYPELGDITNLTQPSYQLGPAGTWTLSSAVPLVGTPDVQVLVPPNTTVYVPLEVTLKVPPAGLNQYCAMCFNVNNSIAVSWTGRSFNLQGNGA